MELESKSKNNVAQDQGIAEENEIRNAQALELS